VRSLAGDKPHPAFGHPPLQGEGLGDHSAGWQHTRSPLLVGEGPGVRSLDSTLLAYPLALAAAQAYPLPSGQARASSSALALGRVRWQHGHR